MKKIKSLLKKTSIKNDSLIILILIAFLGSLFLLTLRLNTNKNLAILQQSRSNTADLSVAETLAQQVVPESGYTINVNWDDTGKKLVAAGGIDLEKYQENYSGEEYQELMTYLTSDENKSITINKDNAYFWVNTLWALGLTQQSQVLDEGVMGTQYRDRVGSFASTGGWTLGSKDAVELYSSASLITLTAEQQTLVNQISQNIYRPCCGNPTSFPDCNHGMAILGLIELMVSQGYGEADIYQAALAFNSYWFSQTYIDLAYYFQTEENTSWEEIDPQRVLSAQFSSAQGYQNIKQQIGTIPGSESVGGSCGA